MDLDNLSTADKVIGASAILFLVATSMPWIAFVAAVGLASGGYMENQESEDAVT